MGISLARNLPVVLFRSLPEWRFAWNATLAGSEEGRLFSQATLKLVTVNIAYLTIQETFLVISKAYSEILALKVLHFENPNTST